MAKTEATLAHPELLFIDEESELQGARERNKQMLFLEPHFENKVLICCLSESFSQDETTADYKKESGLYVAIPFIQKKEYFPQFYSHLQKSKYLKKNRTSKCGFCCLVIFWCHLKKCI